VQRLPFVGGDRLIAGLVGRQIGVERSDVSRMILRPPPAPALLPPRRMNSWYEDGMTVVAYR